MSCKVRTVSDPVDPMFNFRTRVLVFRLRNRPQSHAIHFDAEPLQLALSRGRARDDAFAQGALARRPSSKVHLNSFDLYW
jgi:hypothetical protein